MILLTLPDNILNVKSAQPGQRALIMTVEAAQVLGAQLLVLAAEHHRAVLGDHAGLLPLPVQIACGEPATAPNM